VTVSSVLRQRKNQITKNGIPIPTNESAQTKIKRNGRFRNIDGEATNKQVSLDMTDTPFYQAQGLNNSLLNWQ
jgi:hypothetical protein